jgi:hypothetical protein
MAAAISRSRLGAVCLLIAGVMFILYPAFRPWTDESTVDGARRAMSSGAWVASHAFAMVGFILVPIGLLSLWGVVRGTRAEPLAFAAVLTSWIGAGFTLPFYGAEDFGLYAIATTSASGETLDLLGMVDAVRLNPVALGMFVAGLLMLAIAGVLAAVAVARSADLPRFAGVPFALGLVLFLPQFATTAPVRIGHGGLLGLGLAWLAVEVWRATDRSAASSRQQMRPRSTDTSA